MSCPSCIQALEQGAYVLYELAAFHPELLPPIPPGGFQRPQDIGDWMVRAAGAMRFRLPPADSPV